MLESFKSNELESKFLSSTLAGNKIIAGGSMGSWSWGAGSYTRDCEFSPFGGYIYFCEGDYTGSVSYDGTVIKS